jgi:hypothetical protein
LSKKVTTEKISTAEPITGGDVILLHDGCDVAMAGSPLLVEATE